MVKPELPGDPWQYTTWEGAERAHLLAGAQLSLRQKLAWLEEAAELANRLAPVAADRAPNRPDSRLRAGRHQPAGRH